MLEYEKIGDVLKVAKAVPVEMLEQNFKAERKYNGAQ